MFKQIAQKISAFGLMVSAVFFVYAGTASAHVTVKPAEVVTAGFQTFSVSVPNEKEISTTRIKLLIPDRLKYVQPTEKAGWQIDIEKDGQGLDAAVKSITWSGGEVKAGFRDDFTFSGQVPETATQIQWKAYQTYSDGTVVSWDKASNGDDHESEDENSGPFSVTEIVANTAADASVMKANQAAADASSTATFALYVAIAGVLVGLAGVYLGTRKR